MGEKITLASRVTVRPFVVRVDLKSALHSLAALLTLTRWPPSIIQPTSGISVPLPARACDPVQILLRPSVFPSRRARRATITHTTRNERMKESESFLHYNGAIIVGGPDVTRAGSVRALTVSFLH